MADLLPAVGTASYNGILFGAKTQTVSLSGKPQWDSAGRTIIYTVWSIRLKTLIADWVLGTDTTLEALKNALLTPAAPFQYSLKGFGDFQINVAATRDVVWGPKPVIFDFKPVGSRNAVWVEWGCDVAIPQCGGNGTPSFRFALMEVCFGLLFSIDTSGLGKTSVTGHLAIPQTRASVGVRTLTDCADFYRANIFPVVPQGWRRDGQEYKLSEDKCRLDFTINDSQMPTALQPDVISAKVKHSLRTETKSLSNWFGTITASYEMTQNAPRWLAWQRFLEVLTERLGYASLYGRQTASGGSTRGYICSLSMEEDDVFGKNMSNFSATYQLPTTFATILKASGLWTPISTANHTLWRLSMGQTMFNVRGYHGLGMQLDANGDLIGDAIIDLCQQPSTERTLTNNGFLPPGVPHELTAFITPPTADQSWMRYESYLQTEADERVIEHKPLSPSPQPTLVANMRSFDPNAVPTTPANLFTSSAGAGTFYSAGQATGVFQWQGVPSLEIFLKGRALRAGYYIQPPALTAINGVNVYSANRKGHEYFIHGIVADYGMPIVGAEWQLRYLVPAIPTGQPGVPDNPLP